MPAGPLIIALVVGLAVSFFMKETYPKSQGYDDAATPRALIRLGPVPASI